MAQLTQVVVVSFCVGFCIGVVVAVVAQYCRRRNEVVVVPPDYHYIRPFDHPDRVARRALIQSG
jgi:hypothetical protein